mgnify:CR=1 FL=1
MSIRLKGVKQKIFITPKDKIELETIISDRIKQEGPNCDLNDIDVSNITDMSWLFADSVNSHFNGDISNWDVSKVKNTCCMFHGSNFNGDISNWNVSNVIDMAMMFADSKFNQDISNWNVSKVIDMSFIFEHCPLKNNPPKWY